MTVDLSTGALPQDWDYKRLQSLLLRCLADAARQGRIVPPNEYEEVIQGFLAEFFERKLPHFDSSRGSFATFAYSEFNWYLRRWLIEYRQWRAKRREFDWLCEPEEKQSDDSAAEWDELREQMHAALESMPGPAGEVFRSFIGSDLRSERALAERFGLTRYRVRGYLREASAYLAARFGRMSELSDQPRNVMEELWGEGRTFQQASQVLDLPVEEVEQIAKRLIQAFGRGLRATKQTSTIIEESIMSKQQAVLQQATAEQVAVQQGTVQQGTVQQGTVQRRTEVLHPQEETLKHAILNADRAALGRILRSKSVREIQETIRKLDFSDLELQRLSQDSSGLQELYNQLRSADDVHDTEPELVLEDMASLKAIGRGLVDVLMVGLPQRIQDWQVVLEKVPLIENAAIVHELLREPDAQAAGPVGKIMARATDFYHEWFASVATA